MSIYDESAQRFKGDTANHQMTVVTFRFADSWEWDLRDWDWWFLWACHAIQWGVAQYEAARVPAGAEA